MNDIHCWKCAELKRKFAEAKTYQLRRDLALELLNHKQKEHSPAKERHA